MNNTIALIMPYFGKWPQWSGLFFDSCKCNTSIDFWFFTDCQVPESTKEAKNMHFVEVSFEDYCNMVSERLGVDFHPAKPIKLCDLKPFYGHIHHDILEGYDFWGYGDCDLVWGDIRAFYTDSLLRRYNVLSTHADRLSGHLAILHNTPKITELPLKHRDWRKILMDENNHAFDEQAFTLMLYPGAKLLWKTHKWIFLKFRFDNEWFAYTRFCDRFNRLAGLHRRRILFTERDTTPWEEPWMTGKKWLYENGHVVDTDTGEEIIYLHFLTLKKLWKGDYCHPTGCKATISFKGIEGTKC